MRISNFLAMKDHFLVFNQTTQVHDEFYNTKILPPSGNSSTFSFVVSGTANTFVYNDTEETWNAHSAITAPLLFALVPRPPARDLGIVSTSNNVLSVTVIPREMVSLGIWGIVGNANTTEMVMLDHTNDIFQLNGTCGNVNKRNLETFDYLSTDQLINTDDISDDDLELNIEEI